jgi:hypothetical protein
MLQFIVSNAATIVISLALAALVAAIVGRGVRGLRSGRGAGCSCGCGSCGACDQREDLQNRIGDERAHR